MSNEEKNLTPENEGVEENKPVTGGQKKLSGGVLAAIIGGAVLVVVAIVLAVLLGGGNGGEQGGGNTDPDGKTTYTITVVDESGAPVVGVEIFFSPKGGVGFPMYTNSEGKASYKTDKEITVSVKSVPSVYTYDKINKTQAPDKNGNLTITITKAAQEDPFVVIVLDQFDNPVEGAKVQICNDEGSCRQPRVTDESGEAFYPFEEGVFRAQLGAGSVDSLPEGYTSDAPEAYVDFDGRTAIIRVTKLSN